MPSHNFRLETIANNTNSYHAIHAPAEEEKAAGGGQSCLGSNWDIEWEL